MLEALYNVTVLAEYGALSYMSAKVVLDWAWEKTVNFLTYNDLWQVPEVENILSLISKEKV